MAEQSASTPSSSVAADPQSKGILGDAWDFVRDMVTGAASKREAEAIKAKDEAIKVRDEAVKVRDEVTKSLSNAREKIAQDHAMQIQGLIRNDSGTRVAKAVYGEDIIDKVDAARKIAKSTKTPEECTKVISDTRIDNLTKRANISEKNIPEDQALELYRSHSNTDFALRIAAEECKKAGLSGKAVTVDSPSKPVVGTKAAPAKQAAIE